MTRWPNVTRGNCGEPEAYGGKKIDWQEGRDLWWHDLGLNSGRLAPGGRDERRRSAVYSLHLRFYR